MHVNFTKEIILKQLFALGSVIKDNKYYAQSLDSISICRNKVIMFKMG